MIIKLQCTSCHHHVDVPVEQVRVERDPWSDVAVFSCPQHGCGAATRVHLHGDDLLALRSAGVDVPGGAAAARLQHPAGRGSGTSFESMATRLDEVATVEDLFDAWG